MRGRKGEERASGWREVKGLVKRKRKELGKKKEYSAEIRFGLLGDTGQE